MKVSFEVASALQRMGERAQYVKIANNGSNALDFHIAFYIGQLAAQEPDAYFHIVSKDTGFDPLIRHLKCKDILASRSSDVNEIPIVRAATAQAPTQKLAIIVADLKRRGAAKPRTPKTLSSTINSLFQKQLSESDLANLLSELEKQGVIAIKDTKISYSLPT